MASREEEKRQRREARLAAEHADASARARTRRLQLALAGLLAVAVAVVAVVALANGGGGDGDGTGPKSTVTDTIAIPAQRLSDLEAAAKEAGCVLRSPPLEGSEHVDTKVRYGTNPPTSGNHNIAPALDGIYAPGNEPAAENFVHSLEHGRIEVQYKPGTPARRVSQLETLVGEPLNGMAVYKVLLFRNNTGMRYAVAATAWGQLLGCPRFNDPAFDAIRAFRVKYVDRGPEIVPPTN